MDKFHLLPFQATWYLAIGSRKQYLSGMGNGLNTPPGNRKIKHRENNKKKELLKKYRLFNTLV